jgi:4-nitrophenyl phosphatase
MAQAADPTRLHAQDSSPTLVNASNVGDYLVTTHDTFLFDMDGVLFVGLQMIARSNEVVRRLVALGKRVVFITNNTTKGRKAVLEKLLGMGFEGIELEQIYTAGYATALHLQSLGFSNSKKVFCMATHGITDELDEAGIEYIGGTAYAKAVAGNLTVPECAELEVHPSVGAVVTGFDANTNYHTMTYACLALQRPDVLFIAAGADKLSPQGSRKVLVPGAGLFSGALEYVTGRKATLVGKPSQFMLDVLFQRHPDLQRSRTVMVGDRIDTDIIFGLRGGLTTLLVLSGCTSPEDMRQCKAEERPRFYAESVEIFADGDDGVHDSDERV